MDATVRRYADLAATVMAGPPRLGPVRWVSVDGPAGSGKTTFARRLTAALRANAVTVAEVHTDDLLAGWTDLESFWPRLNDQVLVPLRAGQALHYHRYDWERGRFRDEPTIAAVPAVLVVEGVGSARATGAPSRSLSVYVHADRALRLARGIERDGEALRPEWLRWMAAEDGHFARERTSERADVLVNGAPLVPHDTEHEYVQIRSAT